MTGFLKGTATALITPFTQSGVNFGALEQTIDYQIEGGTDALVILGTTGEPATMTEREKEEVMRFAVKKCFIFSLTSVFLCGSVLRKPSVSNILSQPKKAVKQKRRKKFPPF